VLRPIPPPPQLAATHDPDGAAGAVLSQLARFDVAEHLALQTRVLKAR
jgi:hypothetical protein